MQARFPRKDRVKKTLIKHYECRHCGKSHPFNICCPNVRDLPIVPGECRSCGTTTKEHANDCQYVAIKDNIGLCTYCQALSHRYADCPQRIADHERSMKEKKKNKQNNKKKEKVRIIAGVMTREQDSDLTVSPEGKEREMGVLSPHEIGEGMNTLSLHRGEPLIQPTVPPQETVCSFCGVATHGHRDCPVLHQYIREQADALAEIRLNEYRQLQGWTSYESPKPIPPGEGPLQRGGGPPGEGTVPGHELPIQNTQKAMGQVKSGIIGSMYPHTTRGMAPGGGKGPPPPGGRGPSADKPIDEMEDEEDEEGDTDEETVSVTSGSQDSMDKLKYQKWGDGGPVYRSSARGPPDDPNDPLREENGKEGRRGPRGHRGQRGRTGPPGKDGAPGPMAPVGPTGFPGRDGLSTTMGPLTSTGLGVPPVFNANLSTIGMENSLHYLGESLNHVMQFQQNVNRNMVEHLNMTVKNQELEGKALGQLVENTRQREFDKLFDSIPIYDGEDPEKFEPWLSKLESACIVGKRDVREVTICSSTGPVLEVLNSIEDKEDWATHRDELCCCFSTNKTRVHAADLLSNFR